MSDRRGPLGGYDFGNKRQYRREVWALFRKELGQDRASADVLLMPSLEGAEIEVALRAGFREQRLHVLDRNPAIVATLRRRFSRINTYGIPLSRIGERAPQGFFAAANLDLTANVGDGFYREVNAFARAGVVRDGGLVAISILRGREMKLGELKRAVEVARAGMEHLPFVEYLPSVLSLNADPSRSDEDNTRLAAVRAALWAGNGWLPPPLLLYRHYKSVSGQTILWCVARLLSQAKLLKVYGGALLATIEKRKDLSPLAKGFASLAVGAALKASLGMVDARPVPFLE